MKPVWGLCRGVQALAARAAPCCTQQNPAEPTARIVRKNVRKVSEIPKGRAGGGDPGFPAELPMLEPGKSLRRKEWQRGILD